MGACSRAGLRDNGGWAGSGWQRTHGGAVVLRMLVQLGASLVVNLDLRLGSGQDLGLRVDLGIRRAAPRRGHRARPVAADGGGRVEFVCDVTGRKKVFNTYFSRIIREPQIRVLNTYYTRTNPRICKVRPRLACDLLFI